MLKWCINKAKREMKEGKKHRGILLTKPDNGRAKKHIEKALTNLDVAAFSTVDRSLGAKFTMGL